MEKLSVSKEFVLAAYKAACCEWKSKIESELPELFKSEFKVGDWVKIVKHEDDALTKSHFPLNSLMRIKNIEESPSYEGCQWIWEERGREALSSNCRLATKEEIESHLIALAEKKGFVKGVAFESPDRCMTRFITKGNKAKCDKISYRFYKDTFNYTHGMNEEVLISGGCAIYSNGVWATIIEEPKTYTFYRNDCEKDTEITFKSTSEQKAKDRLSEIVGCDYNNYKLKN